MRIINVWMKLGTLLMLLSSAPVFADKAPGFTLDSDKGKLTLSQYKGKVVYLDFWASWCGPCRKSFPWMNEMQKKYGAEGLAVVGINLDESRDDAAGFLKQIPAHFDIAYDPSGATPEQYGVAVMPTSYLIDRKGNLVHIHKGFKQSEIESVENLIKQELKK